MLALVIGRYVFRLRYVLLNGEPNGRSEMDIETGYYRGERMFARRSREAFSVGFDFYEKAKCRGNPRIAAPSSRAMSRVQRILCVCVCVKIVSPGLAYIRRRNYESITRSRARLSPDCPRGLPESARTYLAREFDTSGKGRSPESDLSDKAGA